MHHKAPAQAEARSQAAPLAHDARDNIAHSAPRTESALVREQSGQRVQARAAARAEAAGQRAQAAQKRAKAAAATRAKAKALARQDPRTIAATLLARRGWSGDQLQCLGKLWTRESSWQVDADNPTSDAYGIPQALPGNRMASAGADWRTNPVTQITWGLGYIADRYGTPCSAWSHEVAIGWY